MSIHPHLAPQLPSQKVTKPANHPSPQADASVRSKKSCQFDFLHETNEPSTPPFSKTITKKHFPDNNFVLLLWWVYFS